MCDTPRVTLIASIMSCCDIGARLTSILLSFFAPGAPLPLCCVASSSSMASSFFMTSRSLRIADSLHTSMISEPWSLHGKQKHAAAKVSHGQTNAEGTQHQSASLSLRGRSRGAGVDRRRGEGSKEIVLTEYPSVRLDSVLKSMTAICSSCSLWCRSASLSDMFWLSWKLVACLVMWARNIDCRPASVGSATYIRFSRRLSMALSRSQGRLLACGG